MQGGGKGIDYAVDPSLKKHSFLSDLELDENDVSGYLLPRNKGETLINVKTTNILRHKNAKIDQVLSKSPPPNLRV